MRHPFVERGHQIIFGTQDRPASMSFVRCLQYGFGLAPCLCLCVSPTS